MWCTSDEVFIAKALILLHHADIYSIVVVVVVGIMVYQNSTYIMLKQVIIKVTCTGHLLAISLRGYNWCKLLKCYCFHCRFTVL